MFRPALPELVRGEVPVPRRNQAVPMGSRSVSVHQARRSQPTTGKREELRISTNASPYLPPIRCIAVNVYALEEHDGREPL